jgi:hypothetical protein
MSEKHDNCVKGALEWILKIAEVPLLEAGEWNDVVLVVDHSGGKDSVRMLGELRDEYPNVRTFCITADTGFEHQTPISAVEWVIDRTIRNAERV